MYVERWERKDGVYEKRRGEGMVLCGEKWGRRNGVERSEEGILNMYM